MKIARRRLLQGLGTALATAPLFRSIPSQANGGEFPRRLVFFASPNNSMDRGAWTADGISDGDALPEVLPEMLSPLEPLREDVLMIGNMVMDTRDKETGPGGHVGMGHQLTGRANNPWVNQSQESEFWASGISLDQYVAEALGGEALTLAALPRGTNGGCRISYKGADLPVNPFEDPGAAYASLFGDSSLPAAEAAAQNARRVRSMDQVAIELERIRSRVAADDREKLDVHLSNILDLQEKLESFSPALCEPVAPDSTETTSSNFPVVARRHMDVLVEALACGVTQVATLQNGNTGGAENYSGTVNWPSEGMSFNRSQHVVAHDYEQSPGNPVFRADRLALEQFYIRQFAYLMERLRSVPEGDGTLLDNTLVVWTKGMGRGHSKDQLLYLIGGGRAIPGYTSGRYLDRTGVPHNDLLVTLANLMGVETETFGDPEITTGPVPL